MTRWLLLTLALFFAGCSQKPWIVGVYTDTNWEVKDRVDTWAFKSDGTWSRETRFTHLNRPTGLASGTYKLDGNKLTMTALRNVSYRNDSQRETDGTATETITVRQDGKRVILDTENKTLEGTMVLTRAP